jgi:twitching motility protein PilU
MNEPNKHPMFGVLMGWLKAVVQKKASDLFLVPGFAPAVKVDGRIQRLAEQNLTPKDTALVARLMMSDKQWGGFEATNECNFAFMHPETGRFRVNAMVQRGSVAIVARRINTVVPEPKQLGLPAILLDIVMEKTGLVLVVGATGSGKSTTLAAMIGYRSNHADEHIVTVEDPIEYVYKHNRSIISQREVGLDTEDWHVALKNALRQAPDVILVGEIRDRQTMEYALEFAETGHLCLATLHSSNADQTIDRILNLFPEEMREQILMVLSINLRGIIAQRLIPKKDNEGRVAAFEVLLPTPAIKEAIFKGELERIKELMRRGEETGMCTFDQSVFELFDAGAIGFEQAIRNADSKNELRLRIRMESRFAAEVGGGGNHLELMDSQ